MRPVSQIALNRRPACRRVVSAVLLAAFATTATGIPLPAGRQLTTASKSNEVFLCATSSCGCATAEQCWQSCCCHTFAEHIAWARANGVRPPEFAIAQARSAGYDLAWLDNQNKDQRKLICRTGSCCDRENSSPPAAAVRSCCSTKQPKKPARTVIAWQALKCSGHSMHWLAAAPTVTEVQSEFIFEIAPPTWLQPPTSDRASGNPDLPALPPPERA